MRLKLRIFQSERFREKKNLFGGESEREMLRGRQRDNLRVKESDYVEKMARHKL